MRITQNRVAYFNGRAFNVLTDRETYPDSAWRTVSVIIIQGTYGRPTGIKHEGRTS